MAVNFNELLEGTELSAEVRGSIQEAWESKLSEARESLTAELREEFAAPARRFGPKYWYGRGTNYFLNLYVRF